ncbi:MAG: heavy metal sensor histidine kinase [Isosphaeraceae bacterium]|nr:heavy metal sensor histidine kinase [Isosphaeraceae bacterium]
MSSARSSSPGWGLRARLVFWTAAVLAASLGVGFAWVHHGLRQVLEARTDAFLDRKAAELAAAARDTQAGGDAALAAEVRREVAAYAAEGLVVVIQRPDGRLVAPPTAAARRVADRLAATDLGPIPRTIDLADDGRRYRVVQTRLETLEGPDTPLLLALSLAETEATLAQFDAHVAGGSIVFLALAVAGGLLLSRQALRPVAQSIRTAQRLNPADLSARLPRTGAGDELDQLAGTINDLLDRLAAYHAQVIRFTADASHELRSPLGVLRTAIEVALQQPRTAADYRHVLESLGEQCDRLAALVNDLLLLARADAGQVELRRVPVDLAALADEVIEMYQPLAEERGLELAWDRPDPIPTQGDPARLRQLLTNLLDNAIKFNEAGGTVTVRVEQAGDRTRLVVADTGVGIPAEHLPHIFERFYQADPARAAGGSGLGLSICRWIAEAHGGAIRAESTSGTGSMFTAEFPAMPASTENRISDGELPVGRA